MWVVAAVLLGRQAVESVVPPVAREGVRVATVRPRERVVVRVRVLRVIVVW